VVHNIGRGPQMEDVLFDWKIIGHYRYYEPGRRQAMFKSDSTLKVAA
jgi:hypothetical protein